MGNPGEDAAPQDGTAQRQDTAPRQETAPRQDTAQRQQDAPAHRLRDAVRVRSWRNGAFAEEGIPLLQVSDHVRAGELVWIDVIDPDSGVLGKIADELRLDHLLVEDAIGRHERAKAVVEDKYLFLNCYAVAIENTKTAELSEHELSAFATKDVLVTVRVSQWAHAAELIRRWDNSPFLCRCGPAGLLYLLLDTVVDGHFEAAEALDDKIEDLGDSIFEDRPLSRESHIYIFSVRRALVKLRRVSLPMRDVLNTLLRRESELLPHTLVPYLQDVYDHVLRVTEQAESLRETVTDLFETNLSLQDQRLNTIMKKLTSWAAIIAVPTAVTGYFGQNVPYPGFGRHWGFALSMVVIVVLAAVLYVSFRRRDWL